MVVELEKLSGKGKFAGLLTNIESYTVREDSTPLLGVDSTGGAGTFDVNVTEDDDSVLFVNNEVKLSDQEKGYTTGTVRNFGSQDGALSLKADSRLAKFVVQRTAAPVSGNLVQVLEYYFELAGIEDHYLIEPTLSERFVAYPAWTDDVWKRLKDICVAEQIEISLVSGNIVVRYPRERNAFMGRNSQVNWDIDSTNLAHFVDVNYYNYAPVINDTIYPIANSPTIPTVITLASGEDTVVELQTDVSLTSVLQPVAVTGALLGDDPLTTSSWYVVNSGTRTVPPDEWYANGGYVHASIDPDDNTRVLLKIRAPMHAQEGSWRLAFRGSAEDQYENSLHMAGTGIRFDKRAVRCATGANPVLVVDDTAQTIDNTAIRTKEQAWAVALDAATQFAGPRFNLDVVSNGIHRTEDYNGTRFLTAAEFNAEHSGKTMNQFNTQYAGMTMDEFNAIYEERFESEFKNQAFGNINGTRVTYRDNIFRIRTATLSPEGIDYTAERDIMAEDFNDTYAGLTMDQFNAMWAGMTFDEFSVMPLRRT